MNNKCEMLHETVVRDIYDVVNSVKDFDEIDWLRTGNNTTGSIAKRTSNLILTFPVLVSTSLSIESATIAAKALEKKYATLLQILFSSMQMTDADGLYQYIRKFHNNINLDKLNLGSIMDTVDLIAEESAGVRIFDKDIYNAMKDDIRNLDYHLEETFNETSLDDYTIKKDIHGNAKVILTEAKKDKNSRLRSRSTPSSTPIASRTVISNNNAQRNLNVTKDDVEFYKNTLTQNDINKANELLPTTMLVHFVKVEGGVKVKQTGIVGVKAKIYPVDSMELINKLSDKYKESNTLFNFVRATTREISFFKDFLFAVDKAKKDAFNVTSSNNPDNAKLFKVLERRATINRFMKVLKKNDASPITSLIISNAEVDYISKYNFIDLNKANTAASIMSKYNLMNITIMDEVLEVAKFLFDDGDNVFETLPYDALQKEAKDNSYKKIVNLMSKIVN